MGCFFTAFVAAPGLLLASAAADAEGGSALSKREEERLWRGETVVRTQSLERGSTMSAGSPVYDRRRARRGCARALRRRRYVAADSAKNARIARDAGHAGGDALVQATQGTALVQATYTLRLHLSGREVRFWMDPRRSHDISDAWGFLRAVPLGDGRTLVTYGVLIDMGPGLLREMFEERGRDLALSVADRVRGYVLQRNAAGRRAAR